MGDPATQVWLGRGSRRRGRRIGLVRLVDVTGVEHLGIQTARRTLCLEPPVADCTPDERRRADERRQRHRLRRLRAAPACAQQLLVTAASRPLVVPFRVVAAGQRCCAAAPWRPPPIARELSSVGTKAAAPFRGPLPFCFGGVL
jgi:hypothetical protein